MDSEPGKFTLKTRAGYYAKKRKKGTYYSNPVWFWTSDLSKARLVTRDQALNIRISLFIETPDLWKDCEIVER